MPIAPAAISLSRTATSRRATPRSRHTRTISTVTTRIAMENQANARSEVRLRPNRLGRAMSVDWGFGSPVQIRLWMQRERPARRGEHRFLHEEREAEGAHRQVEAADPQGGQADEDRDHGGDRAREGEQQDQGDAAAQVRGHDRPHRDQPELAERHLTGPAGQHGERQRDDAVDADLREQERPPGADHERQEHDDDDRRDDARAADALPEPRRPGGAGRPTRAATTSAPPSGPPSAAPRRAPAARRAAGAKRISSTVGRVGDVPVEDLDDDPEADPGDERQR